MSLSKLRPYGLKSRLTLMMALLLGATLSLLYLLNLQAERVILGEVEETVRRAGADVNRYLVMHDCRGEEPDPFLREEVLNHPWFPSTGRLRDPALGLREYLEAAQEVLLAERLKVRTARDLHGRTGVFRIRFKITGGQGPMGVVRATRIAATATGEIPKPADHVAPGTPGGRIEAAMGVSCDEPSQDITVPLAPVQGLIGNLRTRNILIVVGVFLMGILLSWLLATRFTTPLRDMKLAFGRVAAGDLGATELSRQPGEVGEMGESFRVMVGKLKENRDLEKRMFEQERFSTLGHLAAGVAHDIRNPLNAIGLTIDHMQDEFCPEDTEKRASYLRFTAAIRGEIARLNSLVSNFLSLAKPAALDVKPNDLNQIIRDLLELIRKEAESRGVSISTELDTDLPAIPLDGERIRAAIMNLVLNALQSIRGEGEVLIQTAVVGREAHLIIRDSGCGISPKDRERVFLPYYTTREEGTGLGLTVSRVTVEGHDGRIDLSSQPGQGTTVTVVLPILGPELES